MSQEFNPFLDHEDETHSENEEGFTHVVPGSLPATRETQNGLVGTGNSGRDSASDRV